MIVVAESGLLHEKLGAKMLVLRPPPRSCSGLPEAVALARVSQVCEVACGETGRCNIMCAAFAISRRASNTCTQRHLGFPALL